MATNNRTFTDEPAVRHRVPLHICITGPQKSGKTWSALELATGEQRVFGGDIFLVDTEEGRGMHYADYFKYRYVAFPPPHGPLDYLEAIRHCVAKGAGVVIIDSMTHEHSGDGGVMDQVEKYLDAKAGDNEYRRAQLTKNAHIKPKAQRKILNREIEQMGIKLAGIFCYRAEQKMLWPAGKDPVRLGWQPDTTSTLFYAMTAGFLLPPYSNGVPNFNPETEAEKLFISLPEQFRGWFKPGMVLTPDVGERMARWAMGETVKPATREPAPIQPGKAPDDPEAMERARLVVAIRGKLGEHGKKGEAADVELALAFAGLKWAAIKLLPVDQLRAGLETLTKTLDGVAALASREPGEDDV